MRIFTKEELIGEWSHNSIRFTLFADETMNFIDLEFSDIVRIGKFVVYDNFLILQYEHLKVQFSKTYKIVKLKNDLILIDYSSIVGNELTFKKTFHNTSLIKQINFVDFEGYLDDLKKEINIPIFNFNTALDKNGKQTNYYRHWDNVQRIAIIAKKDFIMDLKENPDIYFSAKKTIRNSELGYYNNIFLFEYDDYEYGYSPFDLTQVYQDYQFNNIHHDYYGFD